MSKPLAALLAGLGLALAAASAHADERAYAVALSGHTASTNTGSAATGRARILVHTAEHSLDLTLDVQGLRMEDLWTRLAGSPMGPIHLHLYGGHDHADPNSSLLFPVPMGPAYSATAGGFRVEMKNVSYAEGALRLKSEVSFEDFVKALDGGQVVLNIHTNAKTDGEISGDVERVKT
jgi:hypothetical protein